MQMKSQLGSALFDIIDLILSSQICSDVETSWILIKSNLQSTSGIIAPTKRKSNSGTDFLYGSVIRFRA